MSILLTLADLFFIGSVSGWCLELVFRKFFSSANPEHKWINPGFCIGPYVPLYGFGLCILYLLASIGDLSGIADSIWGKALLFLGMAVSMTLIEYIAGIMLLKGAKLRLWDYSKLWGNIDGLICPLFSFFWAVLGGVYYFVLHPHKPKRDHLSVPGKTATLCFHGCHPDKLPVHAGYRFRRGVTSKEAVYPLNGLTQPVLRSVLYPGQSHLYNVGYEDLRYGKEHPEDLHPQILSQPSAFPFRHRRDHLPCFMLRFICLQTVHQRRLCFRHQLPDFFICLSIC